MALRERMSLLRSTQPIMQRNFWHEKREPQTAGGTLDVVKLGDGKAACSLEEL